LEKQVSRWAQDIVYSPPVPLEQIKAAALSDAGGDDDKTEASQMHVQNLLRHALSETISEGVINCLIITNSSEANVQLTRIHEHLFARMSLSCTRYLNTLTNSCTMFQEIQ
jgi:hypothetical protein